ncbi:MAG TPA: hypothetical protein VFF79_12245 [Conexibacter sp.]|jgi:hypothetical protein|nr:hypothetical protein [Conexibacter sp.]
MEPELERLRRLAVGVGYRNRQARANLGPLSDLALRERPAGA